MGDVLYSHARHEPLIERPWSDKRARDELTRLVRGIVDDYRGEALWANHPRDLDVGDPDVPRRTMYLGAGGIVWALARLERQGLADTGLPLTSIAESLCVDWYSHPEFTEDYPAPQPSLFLGESGLLALTEALAPDATRRDRLADVVLANERNPTRELLWGSPGTMHVAFDLWRHTGDERWAALWQSSAQWLIDEWRDDVWQQDMYGSLASYVGAGHGFAGNAHALLRGRELLEPRAAVAIERRVAAVLTRHAQRDGWAVRWPEQLDRVHPPERWRTQWCHGSPGIVIALADHLARTPEADELLLGGGELTWRAGPLRDNASLCHGTAGNGYALLKLFARTGDEVWLSRARAFALHAVDQARDARYPLFTGAAGVAAFLADCIAEDRPRFPLIDGTMP